MKAATSTQAHMLRQDEGDWLLRLLSDIQREVASQPSPRAVGRMRERLLGSMQRPTKAAA